MNTIFSLISIIRFQLNKYYCQAWDAEGKIYEKQTLNLLLIIDITRRNKENCDRKKC